MLVENQKNEESLTKEQNMNMILESDLATLKQQVFCMQLDWKKEQDVTLQLENDLTFKEDQL